jgi:hypothetical protein
VGAATATEVLEAIARPFETEASTR